MMVAVVNQFNQVGLMLAQLDVFVQMWSHPVSQAMHQA